MVTYVNDLRLSELATGEGSGTWGTTTNTNLELIGEALGYGTQNCFTSDANATTTVADGATDPARAMYFKVTSSATLSATRELTIAPNTVNRVMIVENATTGGRTITIKQGSGATVDVPNAQVAILYMDGAGSGAAVTTVADLSAISVALKENNSIYIGSDPSGTTDTASNNVALGVNALDAITTGDNNVAIGAEAGGAMTSGHSNVAIGYLALDANTSAANNVAIGRRL